MRILITTFLLIIIAAPIWSFSCQDNPLIIQKPIQFDEKRIALTREYQLIHYGIASQSIEIEPKIIILHWTATATLNGAFQLFNLPTLSGSRDDLPGNLNVSSHFLVDRDGTIYQLMPETWMARHVIGLNHYAIGIENIGGVNGKQDLTEEQIKANAELICYLKKKYPGIQDVIGHMDYLQYKVTNLWLEKNPDYQTKKIDPGQEFLDRVLKLVE